MVLIDIGNTYCKILKKNEYITIESKKIFDWLIKYHNNKIYLCSVNPNITNKIKKLYPEIHILDNKIYDNLFKIKNPLIYKKGSDRIITGYGGIKKYGENLIVIDMGTCITLDVYKKGDYISGYIYPGLNAIRNALNNIVKHLPTPLDPMTYSEDIIDTSDQIFWADIYGCIGAINQFVNIEKKKFDKGFKIILAGGTIKEFNVFLKHNKIENLFDFDYIIDDKLIFESMKLIIKEKKYEGEK